MPTLFDQLVAITSALRVEVGLPSTKLDSGIRAEVPSWGGNVINRLGKTIFKSIKRFRHGWEFNWRDYGRMIGFLNRAEAFWEYDVPRILEREFGAVTDEEFERLKPRLGLDQLRARCVRLLGRPVTEAEPLETLLEEIGAREKTQRERIRQTAFRHVAQQSPKVAALFYKGMAEGYTMFLDEDGGFSGDRGRTEVYLNLLGCMLEVENLRRTLPPTTRARFYDSLADTFKLRSKAYDWFNDVCDDIRFPLNNLGRPRRNSAPCL